MEKIEVVNKQADQIFQVRSSNSQIFNYDSNGFTRRYSFDER